MIRSLDRVLLGLGAVSLVASVAAAAAIPHPLGPVIAHAWVWGAVVPGYAVGAFAVLVRPQHVSAQWLARAGSLLTIETAGRRFLPLLGDVDPGWWLAGAVALQLAVLATTAAIASVLVVFPDEACRFPYQRRLLRALWALVPGLPLVLTLSQPTLFFPPSWFGPTPANPAAVAALTPLAGLGEAAFDLRSLLWATGAASMVVRYRRANASVRSQFLWPLTVGLLLTTYDLAFRLADALTTADLAAPLLFGGWVPGFALLSLSILVALLRHRLIGVDLWLRRSLLLGGATAAIALAFLGLAGMLGVVVGQRASLGVGILATLVAVVASQPARRRLDDVAHRWVFGVHVAGRELLRRAGGTLEDAYDVGQLSANLAETIVTGLQVDWVRITVRADGGGPDVAVASCGVSLEEPVTPDLVVPLTSTEEVLGRIECGPKRVGELSPSDEELLATVARQAALAVVNARLTTELGRRLDELRRQADELAASRSRLVQAQLEERRRIERNIHDGVQQDLVAATARLRLARNQLVRDPALAGGTLESLQGLIRHTIEGIRELSRGIHPAVLTHRGLTEALEAQAARLPIDVRLELSPRAQRRYAEDIEAAAYFVVSEGLANVLKHAGADQALILVDDAGGWLEVEVVDHGAGCDPREACRGSGLVGLRDRVESVGGTLLLEGRAGHGLRLRARLPARDGSPTHV